MEFYEVKVTEFWNGSFGDEFSDVLEKYYYKDETLARLKLNSLKTEYESETENSSWFTFELNTLNTED